MEDLIRKAEAEDMPRILAIYAVARRKMAENGNPGQWGTINPRGALLWEDIRKGNLYVISQEERIRGVFALIFGEDPTYREIFGGSWSCQRDYGTIHRIAGDGGGILRTCLEYAFRRVPYIRIDTHRDNGVMLHLLEKYGFRRCGIIHLENGEERIAFDRLVETE